eukprot:scaffold147950_cov27-Prasinocladus_malaysianus.AAC.1
MTEVAKFKYKYEYMSHAIRTRHVPVPITKSLMSTRTEGFVHNNWLRDERMVTSTTDGNENSQESRPDRHDVRHSSGPLESTLHLAVVSDTPATRARALD